MKRKSLSILFVVVLISSFMGSLALAPASSPLVSEVQAAPGATLHVVPFELEKSGSGSATWSQTDSHTGSHSVELTTTAATGDYAGFGFTPVVGLGGFDGTIDSITGLGFWYKHTDYNSWPGPRFAISLEEGGTDYLTVSGSAENETSWTRADGLTGDNLTTTGADDEVWWYGTWNGSDPGSYNQTAGPVSFADLTTALTGADVLRVAIYMGVVDGGVGAGSAYIDDPDVNGTTYYGYIQDAVDAADPGDTVIVHPGTYDEDTTVIDKSLTLESASGNRRDTIIDNFGSVEIEIVGPTSPFSGHAVIDGFTITGGTYGIYISEGLAHGGTVTVSNCFIYNNGDGIYADGDLDGGIFVDECIITDNGFSPGDGIYLDNVIGTVEVTDSVIGGYWDGETSYSGNSEYGIYINEIAETGTVLIDESKITDNGMDGIHVAGTTSVNGELTITDNIIGAYDYDLSSGAGYFNGNNGYGIYIDAVGEDGVVTIEGNKIADNMGDGIDFGSDLSVHGEVTINDNKIGAWTDYVVDDEVVYIRKYGGNNNNCGIFISNIASEGSMTITNNQIAENGYTGIRIATTSGDTTISGNDVGRWTETVPGVEPNTAFSDPGPWLIETDLGEGTVTCLGNIGSGIHVNNVPEGSLTIGPDNTIAGNADSGIYMGQNSNGDGEVTINDNFIDDNGTGGWGIYLNIIDYATVSGNTITRHIEGTDWLAGIELCFDSDCNAIVNNTITGNWVGVYINSGCDRNGIVGNVISNNALDGIWVEGDYNDILRNVISGNTGAAGDHYCGIFLGSGAVDNVIYYNNITDNTDVGSYGVYNNRTEDVDARWNWWGGDDSHLPESYGPFHGGTNPYGEGDAVSSYVDYSEWETTAYPYDTDPTVTPWDTSGPDIDMAVAVPDMVSIYTALSEITDSSWTAETPFSLGPCDDDSRYCVITSDVDAEVPRGVRYVTIDLKDTLEQLLGGTKLEDIEEIEQWFISLVERHGQLKLCEGDFCCDTVWTVEIPRLWYLDKLLDFLGEEQFFLMLEPGELEVPVTVTDWAGNETETTIDIAIVDEQLPVGEGWNLRSTPINLGINDWEHLTALGDGLDYDTAIRWNSELQTWEQLTDDGLLRGGVIVGDAILIPLDAIAIKAFNFDSLGLIFNRDTTAAPSLGVHYGWNLIGLAVSPPHEPFMPVDDALISIEEISPDGTRGYIIVDSPRQYVEVIKEYECATCCGSIMYDWYFGQEDWEYLHHGAEAVPPIPLMTIGGGYWVFMERDDTLAGFSNTPVFLSLELEQHEDLDCVPRYPGTTMVYYEDWMDCGYPECWAGLQWSYIEYKGEFTLGDVFDFYEDGMPEVCDWQFAGKGFDPTVDGYDHGYISFWKHIGLPSEPYTMMCNIDIHVYADGPDYLNISYVPFDIPTCPGTNLIMWETWYDGGECPYLEFKGNATIEEAVEFYVEAMAKLQWEVEGTCSMCDMRYKLLFTKPQYDCGEEIMLLLWVDIYNLDPEIESGIIQVEINRESQPIEDPIPSLSVWCPSYGDPDYCCLPSYPDTTMINYYDWMDEEFCAMMSEELACVGGLQWSMSIYEGEFILADFFNFYEEEMPAACDWQFAGKGILYQDGGNAEGYIGFWKHIELPSEPYTLIAGMWAEVHADGPDYIYVLYVPLDIPTCPGTNLIVWETLFGLLEFDGLCPLYLEFDGSATVDEALAFYIEAMAKLQWDAVDGYMPAPDTYVTEFVKPMILCGEPIMLRCDVVITEISPGIIFVEIYRYWGPIIGP